MGCQFTVKETSTHSGLSEDACFGPWEETGASSDDLCGHSQNRAALHIQAEAKE